MDICQTCKTSLNKLLHKTTYNCKDTSCFFKSTPNVTYKHKLCQVLLVALLKLPDIKIKTNNNYNIKYDSNIHDIIIEREYYTRDTNEKRCADVALCKKNGDIIFIFEVCNTHKTMSNARVDYDNQWVELLCSDIHSNYIKHIYDITPILTDIRLLAADVIDKTLLVKQSCAGSGKTYSSVRLYKNNDYFIYKKYIFIAKTHSSRSSIISAIVSMSESSPDVIKINYTTNVDLTKNYYQFLYKNGDKSSIIEFYVCTVDSFISSLSDKSNITHKDFSDFFINMTNAVGYKSALKQLPVIKLEDVEVTLDINTLVIVDESQDLDESYIYAFKAISNLYKNSFYFIGDILQSVFKTDNGFKKLFDVYEKNDDDMNNVDKELKKSINILPQTNKIIRFHNEKLLDFLNKEIKYEKYGLVPIDKINDTKCPISNGTPVSVSKSLDTDDIYGCITETLEKNIFKKFNDTIPSDVLIIFPFLKNTNLINKITVGLHYYWKDRLKDKSYNSLPRVRSYIESIMNIEENDSSNNDNRTSNDNRVSNDNKNGYDIKHHNFCVSHSSVLGEPINLLDSERSTRICSIHSAKGTTRRFVFYIKYSDTELGNTFNTEQLGIDSLHNVAYTRSEKLLYVLKIKDKFTMNTILSVRKFEDIIISRNIKNKYNINGNDYNLTIGELIKDSLSDKIFDIENDLDDNKLLSNENPLIDMNYHIIRADLAMHKIIDTFSCLKDFTKTFAFIYSNIVVALYYFTKNKNKIVIVYTMKEHDEKLRCFKECFKEFMDFCAPKGGMFPSLDKKKRFCETRDYDVQFPFPNIYKDNMIELIVSKLNNIIEDICNPVGGDKSVDFSNIMFNNKIRNDFFNVYFLRYVDSKLYNKTFSNELVMINLFKLRFSRRLEVGLENVKNHFRAIDRTMSILLKEVSDDIIVSKSANNISLDDDGKIRIRVGSKIHAREYEDAINTQINNDDEDGEIKSNKSIENIYDFINHSIPTNFLFSYDKDRYKYIFSLHTTVTELNFDKIKLSFLLNNILFPDNRFEKETVLTLNRVKLIHLKIVNNKSLYYKKLKILIILTLFREEFIGDVKTVIKHMYAKSNYDYDTFRKQLKTGKNIYIENFIDEEDEDGNYTNNDILEEYLKYSGSDDVDDINDTEKKFSELYSDYLFIKLLDLLKKTEKWIRPLKDLNLPDYTKHNKVDLFRNIIFKYLSYFSETESTDNLNSYILEYIKLYLKYRKETSLKKKDLFYDQFEIFKTTPEYENFVNQ
jgi:hypothetical protein